MPARGFARPHILLLVATMVVAAACDYGAGGTSSNTSGSSTSSTTPTGPTTPTNPGTPTTPTPTPSGLTYTRDIAPIMSSDCVRCHGPALRGGGYDLSSYAGVMRAVTAGSASSKLVKVTQSNGIMYPALTGDRAGKSATIRDWVVTWKAQQ